MAWIDCNPRVQFFPGASAFGARQQPEALHRACERLRYGKILICELPAWADHIEFGADSVVECSGHARSYLAPELDVCTMLAENEGQPLSVAVSG